VLPVLVLAPVGLLAILGVAPELARLFAGNAAGTGQLGAGGVGRAALAFYIALNVDWVVVSLVLVYVYRVMGPRRPGWRASIAGAFFTGAFISGFVQGFVIFLAVPVDLGSPFGGFDAVGAVVAVALWMWLFTALSVLGYAITLALDGRPASPPRK
jgi:membrane protein